MNADQLIRYLTAQQQAIEALIQQLDEVQVAFNAQFDEWKAMHDAKLDHLTEQVFAEFNADVADRPDPLPPALRTAIEERLLEEQQRIKERRQKLREEYLPQRQKAADALLQKAQAELAELRTLNPQLDAEEEELKQQKVGLEARLAELNEEIRQRSRGLGVVRHFVSITKADRERQRIIGKLEAVNDSLYHLRRRWEREHQEAEKFQSAYQEQWQLESIAAARLQSELDQLDDEAASAALALRRAVRHVLDDLKGLSTSADPELDAGLQEMVKLNKQTDDYHDGLASTGGLIGLLQGINSGMATIHKSVQGLRNEQEMHSAYLKPLQFSLPAPVEAFHKQWPVLADQFADEKTVGQHPVEFSANVEPILEGPLAQAEIEAMFNALGEMIKRATASW